MPGEKWTCHATAVRAVLAAGAALFVVGACATSPTTTTAPSPATQPAPPSTAVRSATLSVTSNLTSAAGVTMNTCERTAVSEPSSYTLSCADGGIRLGELRWSSWGSATAQASGTLWENDCVPDCADGHEIAYPASATASALTGNRYTRLHVDAPPASGGPRDYTIGPYGPQ